MYPDQVSLRPRSFKQIYPDSGRPPRCILYATSVLLPQTEVSTFLILLILLSFININYYLFLGIYIANTEFFFHDLSFFYWDLIIVNVQHDSW